ncbi:hypothetical protein CB1_000993043 [Camelus ferus]|nr:hypothetical protein CB1_000993043 [Camelus ferus]
MNELLGWYGYDKVELKDGEDIEFRSYPTDGESRQHISVLKEDDVSNVQIMCAWCQKVGIKRYSLSMGSEVKSFCSEKCFAACRRAYFKRNKVSDAHLEKGGSASFQRTLQLYALRSQTIRGPAGHLPSAAALLFSQALRGTGPYVRIPSYI